MTLDYTFIDEGTLRITLYTRNNSKCKEYALYALGRDIQKLGYVVSKPNRYGQIYARLLSDTTKILPFIQKQQLEYLMQQLFEIGYVADREK